MSYQNRVTPRSSIIATPARGMFMGNRGILHDAAARIRRQYVGKRWIICDLHVNLAQHRVMQPNAYTHLFFLDEATALAAGHRPCALCQRERFVAFRSHWAQANPAQAGSAQPLVDTIDAVLHHERLAGDRRSGWRQATYAAPLGSLPDGAFVLAQGDATPMLVYGGALLPWQPAGYGAPLPLDTAAHVAVLTPRSTVRALQHGYVPVVHASAQAQA